MFSLKDLSVRKNNAGLDLDDKLNSFVGIKRNSSSAKLEFYLPKGFEDFPTDDYEAVKKLFFRTYRTYRKFFDDKRSLSDINTSDGFSEIEGGYTLVGKDENIATYSKLNVFDSILDAYNELQILSLQNKLSRSSEINYSRIEKYLHRGIYMEDDVVFIDEMEIPKKIIDLDSPTLVQMFCYIYSEIKTALEENIESHRTISLAHDFREKFLHQQSSIFDQETFNETLAILKDTLDDIDKFTAYKDEDYWHFYNAIYTFLYGENEYENSGEGNVWGLENFAFVWEELCFHFAQTQEFSDNQILFADRFGKFSSFNGFRNPFFIQINGRYKRFLRPDLVVVDNNFSESQFLDIISSIFKMEKVEVPFGIGVRHNLKLTPVDSNHGFADLWRIYNKWVEQNPSVRKHPERIHYRNVAEQNVEQFLEEFMVHFYSLDTTQLINRKPLLFSFSVIDYKYVSEKQFQSDYLSSERKHDIKKQMVYEMALQSGYDTRNTQSEFWIPAFSPDSSLKIVKLEPVNSLISNNGISVYRLNFEYLQQLYLS